MTREEKIQQLETALTDGHQMVFLLKQLFIQNLEQLPDSQIDAFLAILANYVPAAT